jgi:Sugar (and other) transporter
MRRRNGVITIFAIGILVTLVPLYQSEVSPPESRGLMVGLHGMLIGTLPLYPQSLECLTNLGL